MSETQSSRRALLQAMTLAGTAGFAGLVSAKTPEANTTTPKHWDVTTEVLVAGSGIAGMSAAVTAIDLGAKVLVLERVRIMAVAPSSMVALLLCVAARVSSEKVGTRILQQNFMLI